MGLGMHRIKTLVGAAGVLALAASVGFADTDLRERAKVELGRRLFFEPGLGRHGKVACSACHDPEHGFSDSRRVSIDESGPTPRHSQPIVDLADTGIGGFHWDGEFATLRELVTSRLGAAEEVSRDGAERLARHLGAGLDEEVELDVRLIARKLPEVLTASGPYGRAVTPSSLPAVTPAGVSGRAITSSTRTPTRGRLRSITRRLEDGRLYNAGFTAAFGTADIDTPRLAEALEAYMLSVRSTENAVDRYLDGDSNALSADAERGLLLFTGKASCSSCHTVSTRTGSTRTGSTRTGSTRTGATHTGGNGSQRALSDGAFHNTGVSFRRGVPGGVGEDVGRRRISLRMAATGSFKTPSLRDVAKRAPFMHDGSFESLEDVVRYYDEGGTPNAHQDSRIRKLDLSDRDVGDLVAFLEALSGDERAGLGAVSSTRPERVRVQIQGIDGRGVSRLTVRVRPRGDRLVGADAMPESFEVRTDREGLLTFPFPASTHVVLEAHGMEIGESRLLPDWTEQTTVLAVPLDTIAVVVRKGPGIRRLPSEISMRADCRTNDKGILRRERTLGKWSALYAAKREDVPKCSTPRSFTLGMSQGKRQTLGIFHLDATGGQMETIDLRADDVDRAAVRARDAAVGDIVARLPELAAMPPRRPPTR